MRLFSLLAAFLIYGAFGSPTPDHLSWAEIATGALLGVACFPSKKWLEPIRLRNETVLPICFILLFVVPSVVGILAGHKTDDMLRDIVPLLFLFLPLFLMPILHADPVRAERFLVASITGAGVLFALRFAAYSFLPYDFEMDDRDPAIHLANAPCLLFAATWLAVTGTRSEMRWWKRSLFCLGGLLCFYPLAVTLQRGAIMLAILMIGAVWAARARNHPGFGLLLAIGAAATLFLFHDDIGNLFETLWRKTEEVGDNARFREFHTVIDAMANTGDLVFGLGWGAKILTAASGFHEVRYTHMFASYLFFKAGLIGAAVYGVLLTRTINNLRFGFTACPVTILCLLPPLFLGFTVYTSFKMLCFGAMLALLECVAQKPSPLLDQA